MNLRLLLLGLSLVGHLVAGYYFLSSTPANQPSRSATASTTKPPAAPLTPASTPSTNPAPAVASSADLSALWPQLDQPSLADYVAKLRQAGFPRSTVKALAAYKLEGELEHFKASIHYPNETVGYWEKPDKSTREQQVAITRFKAEADERLRSALGADEVSSAADLAQLTERWGNFAPDKLRALSAIEQDYRDIFTASISDTPPGESPGNVYALLENERNADIAAALGPDDFFEFRIRRSQLAASLRRTFGSAGLSEPEFRAIFRAVDAASSAPQPANDTPAPSMTSGFVRYDGNNASLLASAAIGQMSATLSSDRIADLQQLAAPDAYQENRLVQRLDLPLSTATTLVSYRNELRRLLSEAARSTPDATPPATLIARVQAIDTDLKALLGTEGYTALKTLSRSQYPTPDEVTTLLAQRSRPPTGG